MATVVGVKKSPNFLTRSVSLAQVSNVIVEFSRHKYFYAIIIRVFEIKNLLPAYLAIICVKLIFPCSVPTWYVLIFLFFACAATLTVRNRVIWNKPSSDKYSSPLRTFSH